MALSSEGAVTYASFGRVNSSCVVWKCGRVFVLESSMSDGEHPGSVVGCAVCSHSFVAARQCICVVSEAGILLDVRGPGGKAPQIDAL